MRRMPIHAEDAVVLLRDAAAKIESGKYDARALLLDWLPPVHHFLHEQTLPPCTCGQWQGSPWSEGYYCQRHHIGAHNVSTPPSMMPMPVTNADFALSSCHTSSEMEMRKP